MNQSSNRSLFSSPRTSCPKQSASLFYHTFAFLSSELFLNTFQKLNRRTPVPFFRFFSLSFHSLDFRSRATALLLYHIHSPLSRKYILRFLSSFCLLCTKARGIHPHNPKTPAEPFDSAGVLEFSYYISAYAINLTITAFCACRRFSASSKISLACASNTFVVISSSRCAGRQWSTMASACACAITSSLI